MSLKKLFLEEDIIQKLKVMNEKELERVLKIVNNMLGEDDNAR